MSKLDAQRAMREAKYARNRAAALERAQAAAGDVASTTTSSATTGSATTSPPVQLVAGPVAAKRTRAAGPAPQTGESCGHRSMNGRTCTREAGHPEKNHRYS